MLLNLSLLLLPLVVGLPLLFAFGGRLPTVLVVVVFLALTATSIIGGIRTAIPASEARTKGPLVLAWYKCTCGIDAIADESRVPHALVLIAPTCESCGWQMRFSRREDYVSNKAWETAKERYRRKHYTGWYCGVLGLASLEASDED